MELLKEEKTISRNSDIISSEVNGEIVMMSVQNGKYYSLNPTGNYIWKVLEKPLSVTDLLKHITTTFNLTEDKTREDVVPFIEDLIKENILTVQ